MAKDIQQDKNASPAPQNLAALLLARHICTDCAGLVTQTYRQSVANDSLHHTLEARYNGPFAQWLMDSLDRPH